MVIDGTFPTVKSPNPETPESFALAQKLAKEVDAQLILGSDPDADRVAIQVKDRKGDYVQISGNQTGVLLLDYLIGAKRRAGDVYKRQATPCPRRRKPSCRPLPTTPKRWKTGSSACWSSAPPACGG